jgi:hypothetical protein
MNCSQGSREVNMENIVIERTYVPAMDQDAYYQMAKEAMGCLDLYRASWIESFLAEDGSSLMCRFQAPDAESIRMVSRGDGAAQKRVWAGEVHDTGRLGLATAVVERRFEEPVTVEEVQAIEDAAAWCLELHKVTFLRTFFSADRKHMLCVYQAPDAESVRLAQLQAKMPVNRVWACRHYTPDNLFS